MKIANKNFEDVYSNPTFVNNSLKNKRVTVNWITKPLVVLVNLENNFTKDILKIILF
jgi:hypothetical protein